MSTGKISPYLRRRRAKRSPSGCGGICGTDLEPMRGHYPFCGILGHEFVGEVVVSPDPDWEGRRVVGEINLVCRRCRMCHRGLEHHCENRRVLGIRDRDGAFAEFLTLPLSHLHAVPNDLPDEKAVLVEPLAAALECPIRPSDRVLVVGPAGSVSSPVFSGSPALILRRWCGMTGRSGCSKGSGFKRLRKVRWPNGTTISWWRQAGRFELARRALRPCGTLVLKSTYVESLKIDLSRIVVDEQRLVGSRCGPFAPALPWPHRPDRSHRGDLSSRRGYAGFCVCRAAGDF